MLNSKLSILVPIPERFRVARLAKHWRAASLLALLLAAAAQAREPGAALLNSERIAQRYGSYGIEVLESGGGLRVSDLYSGESTDRVTRTLAVVRFLEPVSNALAAEHRVILAGGSIGAVLKAAGWQVDKRHLLTGELHEEPAWAPVWRRMRVSPAPLAVHVYELRARRGEVDVIYARISEVYHPDYLAKDDLAVLFPGAHSGLAPQDGANALLDDLRAGVGMLGGASN